MRQPVFSRRVCAPWMDTLMQRQLSAVSLRRLLVQARSPRFLLQAVALIALLIVWYFVGASIWNVPLINGVTQYDLIWPLQAGRMLLSGGDPYSPTQEAPASI